MWCGRGNKVAYQIATVNGVKCVVDSGAPTTPVSDVTGDGGDVIASSAAILANAAGATWQNVAWVDATKGSNVTGSLGRPDKPYATIAAAQTAALTAGGTWLIHIRAGAYTDTGLLPGDADATLAYYYDPGTTHTITGSGNLYDWTGDHSGKILYILGHCRFLSNSSTTGAVVMTAYSTTKCYQFHIQCQDIVNANARGATMLDIRIASGNLGDEGSSIRVEYSMDDGQGSNSQFYFRIDARIVYIFCNFLRGLRTDGSGRFIVDCGYAERIHNAYNAFSATTLNVFARYRIKGTGSGNPAIVNRRGELVVMSQKYENTDGQDNIIQIPSNADTSDGVKITVVGGFFRSWSGGSAVPIEFKAVNSLFKLRLINVGPIIVENSATTCILSGSAQTIESYGPLVSNKDKSANITVRAPTTLNDGTIWTGF